MSAPVSKVAVKYIGRREEYIDRLYGTGLSFAHGQVREVPEQVARKFLRHADLFERADVVREQQKQEKQEKGSKKEPPTDDTAAKLQLAEQKKQAEQGAAARLQDLRDEVNAMEKDALQEFALTKYQQKVPKNLSVDNMRARVVGLIDQFGAV